MLERFGGMDRTRTHLGGHVCTDVHEAFLEPLGSVRDALEETRSVDLGAKGTSEAVARRDVKVKRSQVRMSGLELQMMH